MSACTAYRIRIAERVPSRSSYGHAGARPRQSPRIEFNLVCIRYQS